MQLPSCNPLERLGESPTHPHCRYSAPGRAFTHSERLHTVCKQRRKSELQMEHAALELHQVRKQLCGKPVALHNQLRQSRQELRIPQFHQSITVPHNPCLPCVISTHALPCESCFEPQNGFEVDRGHNRHATPNLAQAPPKIPLTRQDGATARPKLVNKIIPQIITKIVTPCHPKNRHPNSPNQPTKAGEQVMRASPSSSFPDRTPCARITCEHA